MFLNEQDKIPFDALRYFAGECNYGGHVTDDKDRRLVNALLGDYYNPDVIGSTRYKFSTTGRYHTPPKGSYKDYVEFIKVRLIFIKFSEVPVSENFIMND